MNENKVVATLADVLSLLDQAELTATRRRDMVSAVKRVCAMAGTPPASVPAEPPLLRGMLSRIRPAAHGISAKSYSNLRSLLTAALQLVGVADPLGRGDARRGHSVGAAARSHRRGQAPVNGLASFANWCTAQGTSPSR